MRDGVVSSRLGGFGMEVREEIIYCYLIEILELRNVLYVGGGFVLIMKSGVGIKL